MGLIITADVPQLVSLGGSGTLTNADALIDALVAYGWTELAGMPAVMDIVINAIPGHGATITFYGVTFHWRDPLQPAVGTPEVLIAATQSLDLQNLLAAIASYTPFTGSQTGLTARLTANSNQFAHCDKDWVGAGSSAVAVTDVNGLHNVYTTGAMRNVRSITNAQGHQYSLRFMRRAPSEVYLTVALSNAAQSIWAADASQTTQYLYLDRMPMWNAAQLGMSVLITGSQFMVFTPGQTVTDRSDLWVCAPYIRSPYSLTNAAFLWTSAGDTSGGFTPTGPRSTAVCGEVGDISGLTFSRQVSKFSALENGAVWVNNASAGQMLNDVAGYEWPEIAWDRDTRLIGYGGIGDFFEPRFCWSYGGPNNTMKIIGQIPDCFVVAGVYPVADSVIAYLGANWRCMSTMEVKDSRIGAMYLRVP